MSWTIERAEELDRVDVLAGLRGRFLLPEGTVYLDGNSLGPVPALLPARLSALVGEEWGKGLVSSWNAAGWMAAPERVGDKIARLIGAGPGEVLAADSTTVALTKALLAAVDARPGRTVLLTSTTNFPSDVYAGSAVAGLRDGVKMVVVEPSRLAASIDEEVAAVFLTQVDYKTGALLDVEGLTAASHEAGALSVWDLCHSAGAVPVGCEEAGVDLAVGCGYKYLNGGPGAPGFLYVRSSLQSSLESPLRGWLGHAAPFDLALSWQPAEGIRRFLTSSPPILGLTALEAGLDAFGGVGIEDLRSKSVRLGEQFVEIVAELDPGLELASPKRPEARGSQVSFRHPQAPEVISRMSSLGVVGDFRPPDLCRFGLAPAYLGHVDIFEAAHRLVEVVRGL